MQTFFTYLILYLSSVLGLNAQNTIEVSVTNFENNNGTAMVALYDSEKTFLKNEHVGLSSEITENKSIIVFTEIPDGVYAISCFHDEDNNGKLNMTLGYIPIEKYGVSNNITSNFGPPKWKDAKFEIKGGKMVEFKIVLR